MFPSMTLYTPVHIKHKALIMHGELVYFSAPWYLYVYVCMYVFYD